MEKKESFFSKQLKKIMYERGLTQKSLAAKLGTDQQMISFWVTSIRNPTVTSVKKIADALDVPISYFMEDSSTKDNSCQDISIMKTKIELLEEKMKRYDMEFTLLRKEIREMRNGNV